MSNDNLNLPELRRAAEDFCRANLHTCCTELIEWQDTATLSDGRFRELAGMCAKYAGHHDDLQVAEYMVKRCATEFVASRSPAGAAVPDTHVVVPKEPTEAQIQAACLNQCTEKFATYDEWWDSHSSGVSERIRRYIADEYRVMLAAAPAAPSQQPQVPEGAGWNDALKAAANVVMKLPLREGFDQDPCKAMAITANAAILNLATPPAQDAGTGDAAAVKLVIEAARKLVKSKGRFHTQHSYMALAEALDGLGRAAE